MRTSSGLGVTRRRWRVLRVGGVFGLSLAFGLSFCFDCAVAGSSDGRACQGADGRCGEKGARTSTVVERTRSRVVRERSASRSWRVGRPGLGSEAAQVLGSGAAQVLGIEAAQVFGGAAQVCGRPGLAKQLGAWVGVPVHEWVPPSI
ncbi:hypothetical protein T484DRAFT_1969522 [Baffinella frigidus]|nr:hypothetical protein T484DRAFT_1969522 [Cryptophyta sp. CCMP2293]